MLFRPSITTRSSSVLIMKAGIGTVGTPMSKLTVDLSSEARGYLTIVCWFYIGTLRVTPSAIEMILGAVPVDFIGGKDVNFIQDQEDFFADVRDRGSLLCIIIPVSENTFDDKLTLDNARAMARPDTYMTPFTGKWSGALKLCSVFGVYIVIEHNLDLTLHMLLLFNIEVLDHLLIQEQEREWITKELVLVERDV